MLDSILPKLKGNISDKMGKRAVFSYQSFYDIKIRR